MASNKKLNANRANAKRSTGPTTKAGKATVRHNATRHGLTGQVSCMTWEDRSAFNEFCAGIVGEYRPEGVIETQLAQSIAEDHWRLNRARAIENNMFALGFSENAADGPSAALNDPQIDAALSQAQTFRDEAKTFNLITLYENRINRNVQRNIDRLRQLQSDRRAFRTTALGELAELNAINKLTAAATKTGPATTHNGFVFSPSEIELAQLRHSRSQLLFEANRLASGPPTRRPAVQFSAQKEAA